LLSPEANIHAVQNKMQALFDKNTKDFIAKAEKEQGMTYKARLLLQPLTDIHLAKKAGPDNGLSDGSKSAYSYILTCIAVFILIIACINFINLAVAQSLKRSKEIGIRKVVGGTRNQLIKQFLVESFLVSLIAFVMAIILTVSILPFFNELANKKLSLSYLTDIKLYAGYFLLLLITVFCCRILSLSCFVIFSTGKSFIWQAKNDGEKPSYPGTDRITICPRNIPDHRYYRC
jgi:putative ABC transport system permease protein